jgi:hypothetical protein
MALLEMQYESGLESTTVTHSTIYHSSGSTGSWTLYRKGELVYFLLPAMMPGTLTNRTWNTLSFTVPEGFRPLVQWANTYANNGDNISEMYAITVKPDGTVRVYPYNGTNAQNNLSIYSGIYIAA